MVGTQRIATVSTQLAQQQAAYLPIKLHAPPLPLPLRIVMQWHRSRQRDEASAWLREIVLQAARRLHRVPAS